jgi:hypothetical protein
MKQPNLETIIRAAIAFPFKQPFTVDQLLAQLPSVVKLEREQIKVVLLVLVNCDLLTSQRSTEGALTFCRNNVGQSRTSRRHSTIVYTQVCESFHATRIAGTCPWCGGFLFEGPRESDAIS